MNTVSEWSGEVEQVPEVKLDNAAVFRLLRHNEYLRDNLASVSCIKDCITQKAFDEAHEAWCELSQDEQTALYIAPSKGGIFTTKERAIIKNNFKEL